MTLNVFIYQLYGLVQSLLRPSEERGNEVQPQLPKISLLPEGPMRMSQERGD